MTSPNFGALLLRTNPIAGNHAHFAIEDPSDSDSSRYNELTDIGKCVSACERALNDTQLSINIREQNRHAAHHSDHPHLVAIFVQCKSDNELQGDTLQAFLASRVSAGPSTSSVNADLSFPVNVDLFFSVEAAAANHERTLRTKNFYSSYS